MNSRKRDVAISAIATLSWSVAIAADLNVSVTSGGSDTVTVVPCGATLTYEVSGVLGNSGNLGLAGFEFDLSFAGGPLLQVDAPTTVPLMNFARPAGMTATGGFGGTVVSGRLLQVGGAQNTMNNNEPPFPIGAVVTGVAHKETVLVTGSIVTPSEPGTYVLSVSNVRATVLVENDQATGYWKVEPAGLGTIANLTIEVLPPEQPATAENDGPACAGESVTLRGGPDGMAAYSWTGLDGFASNQQNPVIFPALPGVYTLTITDPNSCTSVAHTTVEALPGPCDPFQDCNGNGVYDGCETDSDNDGVIDDCETDGCTPPGCGDGNDCTDDICDPVAGCRYENRPEGTPCGDIGDGPCDHPDTCDGQGQCLANLEPSTTVCRPATGECDRPEYCSGTGAECPPDVFLPEGKTCGNSDGGDCDKPDSCDGLGNCLANLLPPTTICRPAVGECDLPEYCTGASRKCPENSLAPAGTPCGDRSETACNRADSCDGAGHCKTNLTADGTSCSDGVFCNGLEECRSGLCADRRDPCIDLQHCDEASQSCLDCVTDSECADTDLCTIDRCEDGRCDHRQDPLCTDRAIIEIGPGSCPTSVNPRSMRALPVVLLGNQAIDVASVDVRSLRLVRADGVGGSVGPTGSGTVRDVSAPTPDDPCLCVFPSRKDGRPDLTLDFAMADLNRAMKLSSLPAGSSITLVLTGRLANGASFEAKDCISIIRPMHETQFSLPKDQRP